MRQRPSLLFAVPFGLACLLAGMVLGRPATGQQQAPDDPPLLERLGRSGRYQAALGGNAGPLVVIDTATGQCWSRSSTVPNGRWYALGTPTAAGK